jgi:hypothetical protein
MPGRGENLLGRTAFHDLTQVHDDHPIRHATHQPENVADHEQRRPLIALNIGQQLGDRRANRYIEGRHRFVGRIEGPTFVYADTDSRRVTTILGYPTDQLAQIG